MPTISAGSSQTFTAGVKDQLFTLTANGGALGTVTGAASASFGPGAERRSFGPFAVGQAITVTVQAGSVIVEYGDASPEDDGANGLVNTDSDGVIRDASGAVLGADAMKWRLGSAIAAYKAGLRTRPPIIMGIGDSNFTGEGGGTGGTALLNGGFAASPMQKISTYAPRLGGLPLRNTAFFGEGNSGNNAIPVGLYDTRITLGSGWDRDGSTGPIGGRFIDGQIGSGFLTVNFGSPLDTVEVHFPTNTTLSAALGVYASDDTLIGTINQSGALGISSQQFTSSKFADGIVKFKNDGAALALISGCICWLSTEKAIIVCQGTWSAATAATYAATTNPWTGLGHMSRIQPDCTIVALTINDINAGTATATYGTNMATVLAVPALWGDVVVATGAPCNATNWTANSTWRTLEREAIKAGALYGAPFVSMHNEFGSWAAGNAQGYFYNNLHMSASGYLKQGQIFARVLSRMAG